MEKKTTQKKPLNIPKEVNFENLAKVFMKLTSERYPSAERVLQLARSLGLDRNIQGQIIVFSQFRDAINEVAPDKIFRSNDHRIEVYNAVIEALEQLEDELDMKEEEQKKRAG